MFLGRYTTYFTGNNRIVLPKKFRQELGNATSFYLIQGQDGEVWGFRDNEWQKEASARLELPITDPEGRKARRSFFGLAEECQLDSQGRFIISAELVTYAGLSGELLMVGAGDHFEIWERSKFERVMSKDRIPDDRL